MKRHFSQRNKESLIDAVVTNDTPRVIALLQSGMHPDFHHNGATPLVEAIKNDNIDIVKALVAAGADVNYASREGLEKSPLDIADMFDAKEIILFLEENGAVSEVDSRVLSTKRALFNAVVEADAQAVKSLLIQGVDPDFVVEGEMSPLIEAIERGQIEIVHLLIQHGSDVNWRNSENVAPLDIAIKSADNEIIDILKNRGAVSGQTARGDYQTIAPVNDDTQTGRPILREDTLKEVFAPDKWVGNLKEMADLWQEVPKRLKADFNFATAYAEAQRKTLKLRANKFKPPARKP